MVTSTDPHYPHDKTWDDVLFEQRHRGYGAYELRRRYNDNIIAAFLLTMLTLLLLTAGPYAVKKLLGKAGLETHEPEPKSDGVIIVDRWLPPVPEKKPEVKQEADLPIEQKKNTPPKLVKNVTTDTINENNDLLYKQTGSTEIKGRDAGAVSGGLPPQEEKKEEKKELPVPDPDQIVNVTEIDPAFPGGIPAFYQFLEKNIEYPTFAIENGIQGKVVLRVLIERDGSISQVKTLSSPNPTLTQEAERVLKQSPKWSPAKVGNRSVRYWYTVAVHFKLKERK